MSEEMIVMCRPLSTMLKQRYGEELNLTRSKARRLEDRGLVKIMGPPKIATSNKKLAIYRPVRRLDAAIHSTVRIPVIIPYAPDGNIGFAYNREMERVDDWVIFIDHDIFLANPLWYDISLAAIRKMGHAAGFITCYTNNIGCRLQRAPHVEKGNHDISYHRQIAKRLYDENRGKVQDLSHTKGARFSGMFILTHKAAWEAAGKFREGGATLNTRFFGVDVDYFTKIKRAGYRVCIMKDLYVYHGYFRETLKPFFTKGVNGANHKIV